MINPAYPMICPVCHEEMEAHAEQTVHSEQKKINYTRTKYVCRKDDIWGQYEVPQTQQTLQPEISVVSA